MRVGSVMEMLLGRLRRVLYGHTQKRFMSTLRDYATRMQHKLCLACSISEVTIWYDPHHTVLGQEDSSDALFTPKCPSSPPSRIAQS